eukprot:scaffold417_cov252-Pinguiococcus_pyrenoidosus.AAC.8
MTSRYSVILASSGPSRRPFFSRFLTSLSTESNDESTPHSPSRPPRSDEDLGGTSTKTPFSPAKSQYRRSDRSIPRQLVRRRRSCRARAVSDRAAASRAFRVMVSSLLVLLFADVSLSSIKRTMSSFSSFWRCRFSRRASSS